MHKIGILSDTHGLLRPEVRTALAGSEVILHGGDINRQSILDELAAIAPVYAVRGNNDKEWAAEIPETRTLTVCGCRVFMVHNKKYIPDDLTDIDLVVYGHSHRYEEKSEAGVRFLNPGSCGPRRFNQEITLALLYIEDDGTLRVEKVEIAHPQKGASKEADVQIPADIGEKIPAIMKDLGAGKTVKQIARRHRISESLAEQIARMYLTHPGVDADGILRRIGL